MTTLCTTNLTEMCNTTCTLLENCY